MLATGSQDLPKLELVSNWGCVGQSVRQAAIFLSHYFIYSLRVSIQ
jgi:hypothetical protein